MADRFSYPLRCVLAIFSGGIYSMAYPPVGWGWLVYPAIAGLLIALKDQQGSRARALGFLHGITAFAVSLSWLFQIFAGVSVVLWVVLAAFPAVFAHFQGVAAARGLGGWKFAVFTMLNWCAWEFVRAELFPLKFPWMTTGLAMGPNLLLPWIGVYGVGLFVVLAASLLSMGKWKSALVPGLALAAVVVFCRPMSAPEAGDPMAMEVGGVQLENVGLDSFISRTKELPAEVEVVVWPEYAIPYDLQKSGGDWESVRALCRERNITLILGTQLHDEATEEWRNIALTVDPTGAKGFHNKVHTVHFFADGTPGTSAESIVTSHGKIGTPICFDTDYEGVCRKMTAHGAETFLVPVMDAMHWTARQHDQHAKLSQVRAAENGRWMFVCATSGVSQVIDPRGMLHARLGAMEQGTIVGRIRRETGLTFYTRAGWLVP